ncbi:MAG TPA: cyclic nucleotide-binding domain-containing protein [Myxococcota bacterium]|nr:cyclic nucleotide-binding domain-containing protein [Myxococcota bacterium]
MSDAPDLKVFAIFADLSEDERELVADMLTRMELDPGDQLFAEGAESEGLVLVERGSVALNSGRAGALGLLMAGDSIGAASLVAVGTREATAIASEPACVLILSRESYRRLAEDAPRAACRMLEVALADLASAVREGLDRYTTET